MSAVQGQKTVTAYFSNGQLLPFVFEPLICDYHGVLGGFNPCGPTAELFVSIFHSFEAEIANAISSFK